MDQHMKNRNNNQTPFGDLIFRH